MKKILYIVLCCCFFTSCESFLNEELKGTHTSKTIFKTQDDADLALTGVYNSLSFTSSSNFIWVFGDVASDDAVKGGASGDQSDIGYISDFNIRADNGVLVTYWQFAYEAISRANNVIHGDFGGDIDNAIKESYIAQAKFVRAYYYFNLVNIWGKVPLRLEPNTPQNVNMALSEVELIYTAIDSDLRDATSLPASYSKPEDAGKVTKGAALGLLAKSKLYQKKWGECIKIITEEIQPLNIYDLEPVYANLFKLGAENSKEVVFAVRHLSGQEPGAGNSLNQWFAPAVEGGYYFDAPTQSFASSFDEKTIYSKTDPRLDASIGRAGEKWLNGNDFESDWSITGYLVKKHDQPLSQVAAGAKGDGGLAYLYLRYADILLMLSESYAQQNNELGKAAAALNLVRNRADLSSLNPITQQQMLDAIYLERRRELGFEFHRFFDLMRWGKDIAKQALGPNFFWEEPRYYFPLPQSEVDANHGIK